MREVKPVTIADLIKHLQTLPPGLPVIYRCCSEYVLLSLDDITQDDLCPARPDGWVHYKRPDQPTVRYLVLPD